jgi:hypothetical protein
VRFLFNSLLSSRKSLVVGVRVKVLEEFPLDGVWRAVAGLFSILGVFGAEIIKFKTYLNCLYLNSDWIFVCSLYFSCHLSLS